MKKPERYKPSDMSESRVWSHFHLAWPYHCERQEPGIGSGQPDVLMLDKHGKRGLIELKRPNKLQLRTSQWTWHEIDQKHKGRSCVVTCDNIKGKIWWRVLWIDVKTNTLIDAHPQAPVMLFYKPFEMNEVLALHLRLSL